MFKPVSPQVNFPEIEKKLLNYWAEKGIVEKYLHRNDSSSKRFSFLDGPITANNPMGVHHAWGRTYKDLWQRFYNMRGYRGRFQNGFDCQGLWVEVEVEKELGLRNKRDIENLVPGDKKASISKFVELCKERVRKFSTIQSEQSKRLGYFMDWDNSYFTMSDENNYMIWHFLKKCYENGWIYKGKDSVPWCPRCETAISQHEMLTEDYKELVHESIYFRLPIETRENEYLLVWTTTPWTIPANIAVAVDPTFDYSLVETSDGKKYWIVKELAEAVFAKEVSRIIRTVKGLALVGLKYKGPFDDLEIVVKMKEKNKENFHTVIPTDTNILPIVLTEGTGLVHTAVSAGVEDFKLGKKLGLPMIPVIADNADYLPHMGFLAGLNAKKHPRIILDHMKEKGFSYKIHNYKHRYPACWRCKTELVWKVTYEWYIAMDKPSQIRNPKSEIRNSRKENKTLRELMMETAKMIKWLPEFGLERELDWLSNMHDWLISKKNRYWGLALPVYECGKCGIFCVIGSKEELKKRSVEGWNEFNGHSPHKPYIDEVKIKCGKCGSLVPRVDDVGNVWLDAGIVPYSTLNYTTDNKYWKDWFPVDFITESFPGQFKNWFYSMIAMSTVLEKRNPFKTVLGYASVLGEDGRPMHKSWGNAIEFNTGADTIGVDVMRWMFVTQNPYENILFGYKKADEVRRRFHLKLWNIYNFLISYALVDNWQPKIRSQKDLTVLDKWILAKLDILIYEVTKSMEKYDAFAASNKIEEFVDDLSVWFVRRIRDRVGPTVENTPDKKIAYTTLHNVLVILTKILAPFMPFVSDEIYRNLTNEESVHLTDFPEVSKGFKPDKKLIEEMELVRRICELGHAKRKELGIKVRQPLKKFEIRSRLNRDEIGEELIQLIKDELNVKEVEIVESKGEMMVELDTKLSPELISEGKARELVRQIQMKRKELGCGLAEKINIELSDYPKEYEDYIKRETLSDKIIQGNSLNIIKS